MGEVSMGEVMGRVRSVNVGAAREVEWHGRTWHTGIFKRPVVGPVRVEGVQMEGDEQADASVHGGPTKSVYAYPSEHYAWWRGTLDDPQAEVLETPGAFGENLTTEGLLESDAGIGDLLRVGSVLLRVTEPRMPCSKLGLRFRDPHMTRRFHDAGRNGLYFGIEESGEIASGDLIVVEARHPDRLTIREVVEFFTGRDPDPAVRVRAATHPALSESWREWFSSAA
jgi:MOSC domain-containing protein YiiM